MDMMHTNYIALLAVLHVLVTAGLGQSINSEVKVYKGRSQLLQCVQPSATSPGHADSKEISFYKTGSPEDLVAFWSVSPGQAVVTDKFKETWKITKTSLGLALTVTPVDRDSVIGVYKCEFSNSVVTNAFITLTWDETSDTRGTKEGKPSAIAIASLVFVILVVFVLIGGILYYFLIIRRNKRRPITEEDAGATTDSLLRFSDLKGKPDAANDPRESKTNTLDNDKTTTSAATSTKWSSSQEDLTNTEGEGKRLGSLSTQGSGSYHQGTTSGGATKTLGNQKQAEDTEPMIDKENDPEDEENDPKDENKQAQAASSPSDETPPTKDKKRLGKCAAQ